MERLIFIDTTTGKEYERMISTRVATDPERRANKINVLKTGVATTAITDEWRKIHEYAHTGRASDVWKDKDDSLRWYAEVNERAKHIEYAGVKNTYVYGIDCEDEQDGFWKRVDSDHPLTDKEKELIMKAACMETVVTSNILNRYCYNVKPIHIDGVTAALGKDLVWDDLDDYPKAKKVDPDEKFSDELNRLLSVTSISIEKGKN